MESKWEISPRSPGTNQSIVGKREMVPPKTAFFIKLRKVVKCYKQFCLAKALESRLEESRLRQHLEFWQVILHHETMLKIEALI